jgi:hypothetical protein
MSQESYIVEQFDVTNNKTVRRTIQPLPQPQRLQPSAPIEKAELTEMIESLRQEMASQQTRFDQRAQLDAERTTRKNELHAKISELYTQLNAAQAELDQLKSEGTVRDGFIRFVKDAESRITGIATGVYNYLLEKISQDKHEASYKELTPLLKEEVTFKVDRSGIRFLTQGMFASLRDAAAEHISDARVEAVLNKVYTATEKLEGALEK